MKLLLDTHAFIWWDSDPERLSGRALALCHDSRNELWLSVASLWEIQIKMQLGKLKLAARLSDIVAAQQETKGAGVQPYFAHAAATVRCARG